MGPGFEAGWLMLGGSVAITDGDWLRPDESV
jgi:hypothetical protein